MAKAGGGMALRKEKRMRRRLMNRTPQERYEWLLALKKGTVCIIRPEDKYRVFRRMEEEFAELSELGDDEANGFSERERCRELSEECGKTADELAKEIPETSRKESRTVMLTASERSAEDKEMGNKPGGVFRWVFLGLVLVLVAVGVCYKIKPTRYIIGHIQHALGFNGMAVTSFRSAGDYSNGWSKALEVEQEMIEETPVGEKVSFGKHDWMVLEHTQDATLLIDYDGYDSWIYDKTGVEETDGNITGGSAIPVTWETSWLRKHLNGKFLKNEFVPEETGVIRETEVKGTENASFDRAETQITNDKVFIASEDDVDHYEDIMEGKTHNMRLRTPGKEPGTTTFVSREGTVIDYGYPSDEEGLIVRPMIWVTHKS